jgi:hypothetical protein
VTTPPYSRPLTNPGAWIVNDAVTVRLDPELSWAIEDFNDEGSRGARFVKANTPARPDQSPNPTAWLMVVDASADPTELDVDSLDPDGLREFARAIASGMGELHEVRKQRLFPVDLMNGRRVLVADFIHDDGVLLLRRHMRRFTHGGRRWVAIYEAGAEDDLLQTVFSEALYRLGLEVDRFSIPFPEPRNDLEPVESTRDLLMQAYRLPDDALPISGGWGYTLQDACVIDRTHPCRDPEAPFNGIGVERLFVEKRMYLELIVMRPPGGKYSGIRWNLDSQELQVHEGRRFDRIVFDVECMRDEDWDRLKAEWEAPSGYGHMDFDEARHLAERSARTLRFKREFWFDVTSFF